MERVARGTGVALLGVLAGVVVAGVVGLLGSAVFSWDTMSGVVTEASQGATPKVRGVVKLLYLLPGIPSAIMGFCVVTWYVKAAGMLRRGWGNIAGVLVVGAVLCAFMFPFAGYFADGGEVSAATLGTAFTYALSPSPWQANGVAIVAWTLGGTLLGAGAAWLRSED